VKVLLVDDEPAILRTLQRYLRKHGHVVQCVSSAVAAVSVVDLEPPDVIISDFRMPGGMNGMELLRYVATKHPLVRRVLLTGLADLTVAERERFVGIEFLQKPCSMLELARICA
jgi:DNA-binding NtrC family response regulator